MAGKARGQPPKYFRRWLQTGPASHTGTDVQPAPSCAAGRGAIKNRIYFGQTSGQSAKDSSTIRGQFANRYPLARESYGGDCDKRERPRSGVTGPQPGCSFIRQSCWTLRRELPTFNNDAGFGVEPHSIFAGGVQIAEK